MTETMVVDLDGFAISNDPTPVAGQPYFKLKELEKYFNPPPVRTKVTDIPLADGAFNPVRSYRTGKHMSLVGFSYGQSAAMAEELAWERIAALSPLGYSMLMTVSTFRGPRTMRVWLDNGEPEVIPFSPVAMRFKVPLFAPDPRKYGPVLTGISGPSGSAADGLAFPLFGSGFLDFGTFSPSGLFYLTNTGKAESWPQFKVRGGIATGFQILSEGQTVTYNASVPVGVEVALSPYIGGRATIGTSDVTSNLVVTEWPSVKPGQTRLYLLNPLGAADANAQLGWTFSPAWW